MTRFRLPPQIERLAILSVVIIALYFTARFFLVPESFGKYGWYRGDALKDYQELPLHFAGAAACVDCHAEVVEAKAQAGHKGIACETCHGPLAAHVEDPSVTPPKIEDPRFCVRCHEANPSRPAKFPQVIVAEHAGVQNCIECHLSHNPAEAP